MSRKDNQKIKLPSGGTLGGKYGKPLVEDECLYEEMRKNHFTKEPIMVFIKKPAHE